MRSAPHLAALAALSTSLVVACGSSDVDIEHSVELDELADQIAAADVSLADAIDAAEGASPDGTVVTAELQWTEDPAHYAVAMLEDDEVLGLELSASDGAILADQRRTPGAAELELLQVATMLVDDSQGWPLIIRTAEIAVAGAAFEARTLPDDERLEVELFAPDGIWKVSSEPDGSGVDLDRVDTEVWEAEQAAQDDPFGASSS